MIVFGIRLAIPFDFFESNFEYALCCFFGRFFGNSFGNLFHPKTQANFKRIYSKISVKISSTIPFEIQSVIRHHPSEIPKEISLSVFG